MKKILMIEDDFELAEILSEYLELNEFRVKICGEPYLGLSELNINTYDLVILDLTLPGLDGLEVCKQIRKKHNVPIIISSARHDLDDKITAFDFGADDYLPKPYDPKELLARIKRHLARVNTDEGAFIAPKNTKKSLVCDEFAHIIKLNGTALALTAAEYDILAYMLKREGGVIRREEFIYNCDAISLDSSPKSIDVIIGRIRTKLGEDPKNPRFINAIRAVGYKLEQ